MKLYSQYDRKKEILRLPEKRVVIAGTGSGCGKTTVTSGILQCLKNRKISAAAFKCGPDYIDPMFHEKILNTKSENLDLFFCGTEEVRRLAAEASQGCEIGVAEGVMGFYDGIGMTEEASTYEAAKALSAPVILVMGGRGMAASLLAVLEGFLHHREDSRIRGVIFNRLPAKLYGRLSRRVRELGVEPLGYLPADSRLEIGNRHLGLVTAGEIENLHEKMRLLARQMEETVDIGGILKIASEAEPLSARVPEKIAAAQKRVRERRESFEGKNRQKIITAESGEFPRIALASDEAFCFTYRSSLTLLESLGAELVPFSPLRDGKLPEDIDGLILSGGYPELYAAQLEKNETMRRSVRHAAEEGMPLLAECGGFIYLHQAVEGADGGGKMYRMAGVIPETCCRGKRLDQFGYISLTPRKSGMAAAPGDTLKAHEFHYWKSTDPGKDFTAKKADGSRDWQCGYSSETMYAGFPHLFLYSSPEAAARFVIRCLEFRRKRRDSEWTERMEREGERNENKMI